jgi:hypothetical protein
MIKFVDNDEKMRYKLKYRIPKREIQKNKIKNSQKKDFFKTEKKMKKSFEV